VKSNAAWLAAIPSAFVAVSLTAALKDDKSPGELREMAEAFFRETGWAPAITRNVAGALRYTEYDYFKRLLMKLIARQQGGETDTSRRSRVHRLGRPDALRRGIPGGDFPAGGRSLDGAARPGARQRDERWQET